MNNELYHLKHPLKLSIYWIAVYLMLIIILSNGVGIATSLTRTHGLPFGKIKLTIPYSKYIVGEKVNFTIINNDNSSIYVLNNCPFEPLAVYRLINSVWVRQHDQASTGSCSSEHRQVSVAPAGRVSGDFSAWRNLFSKPGKYRIVAFVEYYNALPYQDIEIIKPTVSSTANLKLTTMSPPTTKGTNATMTIDDKPQATAIPESNVDTAED